MKELETIERAFPQVYEYTLEDGTKAKTVRYGMTLRDYFAAKAMQGLLSSEVELLADLFEFSNSRSITKIAWEMADAMMKEREQ